MKKDVESNIKFQEKLEAQNLARASYKVNCAACAMEPMRVEKPALSDCTGSGVGDTLFEEAENAEEEAKELHKKYQKLMASHTGGKEHEDHEEEA